MEINRLIEQRIPLALAIFGAIAVVVGGLTLVEPLWAKAVMVVTVLVAVGLGGNYERRKRLNELLSIAPVRISALTAEDFGAKASAIARAIYPNDPPPYVYRESCDRDLDKALGGDNRFIVVVGVTNAGKTRALYEAIGRVLSDSKVVMPAEPTDDLPDTLGRLVGTGWLLRRRGKYVLVLNDLENWLSGLRRLAIRRWLNSHPNSVVVATTSIKYWASVLNAEQQQGNHAKGQLWRRVKKVPFDDEFEGKPLAEARRLYRLPAGQTRLGAYLAAADRTIADFDAAERDGPARALALTGIDCARAGMTRPIEVAKLTEMARRRGRREFSDEELGEAIAYCTKTAEGVSGILEVSTAESDRSARTVTANPVLVERLDREGERRGVLPQIPTPVWREVVDLIVEGPYDLLAVAAAAETRGRKDLSEELLQRVIEEGSGAARDIAENRVKESSRAIESREVSGLLDRASIGPSPLRPTFSSELGIDPRQPPPTSGIFDPRMHRSERWYARYRHQSVRDFLRFCFLLLFDVTAVGAGIAATLTLGPIPLNSPDRNGASALTIALVAALLVLTFFLLFGLYRADRERARLGEIIKGTGLTALFLAVGAVGVGYSVSNVPLVVVAAIGAGFLAYLFRWLYDRVSRRWVEDRGLQSRVLLVASDEPAEVATLISNACRRPMQFVGFLAPKEQSGPGWIDTTDRLEEVASAYRVDRVIVADGRLSPQERLALIYRCHIRELATDIVPTAAELFQGESDALDDMVVPLIRVRPLYLGYVDRRTKRAMDLVLGIPLTLVALVFLFFVAIPMKLRRRGEPILTRDRRFGLGESRFGMWRLRTSHGDGVVTTRGHFLDRMRIDELPQLLNVLAGNMSIVGPRPIDDEEFEYLDDFQRARYAVLPGITGLWQIARRKESSHDDMSNLDIIYCRKWTPLLDVTIMLRTIFAVARPPVQ